MAIIDDEGGGICIRVGRKIKEARRDQGLTQAALSELSGVGLGNLQRIEKGGNPTLEVLEALSLALKCEISDFL